jgi:hypothetical protein
MPPPLPACCSTGSKTKPGLWGKLKAAAGAPVGALVSAAWQAVMGHGQVRHYAGL